MFSSFDDCAKNEILEFIEGIEDFKRLIARRNIDINRFKKLTPKEFSLTMEIDDCEESYFFNLGFLMRELGIITDCGYTGVICDDLPLRSHSMIQTTESHFSDAENGYGDLFSLKKETLSAKTFDELYGIMHSKGLLFVNNFMIDQTGYGNTNALTPLDGTSPYLLVDIEEGLSSNLEIVIDMLDSSDKFVKRYNSGERMSVITVNKAQVESDINNYSFAISHFSKFPNDSDGNSPTMNYFSDYMSGDIFYELRGNGIDKSLVSIRKDGPSIGIHLGGVKSAKYRNHR